MPLGIDHLATVGFIMGNGVRDGQWVRKPVGTAFRVSVRGQTMEHGYLVTAAHVLWDQSDPTVRFRIPGPEGAFIEETPLPEWYEHWDADVVVAPLPDTGPDVLRHAISMETQTVGEDILPMFGQNVYYVGLLDPAWLMADAALPMVRSGTVGMIYVPVQPDRDKPPFQAHLIDCRSYAGFSGSPCLVQFPFPGPAQAEHPIPKRLLEERSVDPDTLGLMTYATVLMGLLIQHIDDANVKPTASNVGIGIILPVERIFDVLMSEELVAKRKKAEAEAPQAPDYKVENLSVSGAPANYRAEDFKRDLKKVTKKLDKPQQ